MKTNKLTFLIFVISLIFFSCSNDDDKYGLDNKQIKIDLEAGEGGTVTGAGAFKHGETINVEAKANEHYAFDGWYIEDEKYSTANPLTIKVEKEMKLTAKFALNSYSISLNSDDGGTVTGGGAYKYGETIQIQATAKEHFIFDGWYIDTEKLSTENPFSIIVEKDLTITAKFKDVLYKIDVTAGEGGTVTGAGEYKFGETIYLEAKPQTEYMFIGWYIDDEQISDANPLTYKVDGKKTIFAKFSKNQYNIILNNEDGGTVTGAGAFASGEKRTITATSGEYHIFVGWYENGILLTKEPNYSFEIFKSREFTAKFLPKIYIEASIILNNYDVVKQNCYPTRTYGYKSSSIVLQTYIYEKNVKKEYFTKEQVNVSFSISHDYSYSAPSPGHSILPCATNSVNSDYSASFNGIAKSEQGFNHQNDRYQFDPIVFRVISFWNIKTDRDKTTQGQPYVLPKQVEIIKDGTAEYMTIN